MRKRRRLSVSGSAAARNAVKASAYGITFDSTKERDYYCMLLIREHAGEVRNIKRQVPFPIAVDGRPVYLFPKVKGARAISWRADFVYDERQPDGSWATVIAEAKGVWTDVARLKVGIVQALYPSAKIRVI